MFRNFQISLATAVVLLLLANGYVWAIVEVFFKKVPGEVTMLGAFAESLLFHSTWILFVFLYTCIVERIINGPYEHRHLKE